MAPIDTPRLNCAIVTWALRYFLTNVRISTVDNRTLKDLLSEQVARVGKALASPKRLEILEMLAQAKRGEFIVLDVRQQSEYDTAHLPFARSLPLPAPAERLAEPPRNVEIVACCRGPFCLMSDEAVKLLQKYGYHARKAFDGVSQWRAAGLPLARP